ncbi:anionic trypsin-2-like [Xyrichtys novacula]|uniref:Anionic trypsin-2-like n=1 Tax=Xyrichtys novacula TaxID=13765 RepID=A0AAV1EXA6_XYRNO|nr:anionic trypsin-2-like [Xyrichtys novacula]
MGNMTRLLLLLLAGLTVSSAENLEKRIVGGATCGNNERQYHVKIVDKHDNFICGGSLISENWVLTAAHCWKKGIKAVLGLHPDPNQAQTVKNKSHKIFKVPVFLIFKKKHDIMLLKLENAISTIPPVPLPDCNNRPAVGAMVQVAGYASTQMGPNNERLNDVSPTLQCVDLEIRDETNTKTCMLASGSRRVRNKAKENWALYRTAGRDTSPGDSGGGVVFNGMLYGVHVFSFNGDYACVAPAGFMQVCEYRAWIEETANVVFP